MTRTLTLLRFGMALFGSLAPVTVATADPVAITIVQGEAAFHQVAHVNGPFSLIGSGGFRWEGFATSGGSHAFCEPCAPGETRSLSTSVVPPFGSSTVTFRGESYHFTFNDGAASVQFNSAPFTFPLSNTGSVTIRVPFTLTGFVSFSDPLGPLASWQLSGGGIATATYDPFAIDHPFGHIYNLRGSVHYDFRNPNAPPDPVPEPATLSLVLGGIGAAAVARRAKKRQI